MARQGLEGISPQFTPVTTLPGVEAHTIPDRVRHGWDQGGLDRCWISDITYLRTGEGWVYLAAVTDGHSRRTIGWAMDTHMHTDLVANGSCAWHTRYAGNCPMTWCSTLIVGAKFTSEQMHRVCQDLQVLQSVGRTGVWLKTMRWPKVCGPR